MNIIKNIWSILLISFAITNATATNKSFTVEDDLIVKMAQSESVNKLLNSVSSVYLTVKFVGKPADSKSSDLAEYNASIEKIAYYYQNVENEFPLYHSMNQSERVAVMEKVMLKSVTIKQNMQCFWNAVKALSSCYLNDAKEEFFFYGCVAGSVALDIAILAALFVAGNAAALATAFIATMTVVPNEVKMCGNVASNYGTSTALIASCSSTFNASVKSCFGQ